MSLVAHDGRREQVKQMDDALASVRIEGLEPSDEAKAIFQRHVDGELTEAEMGAALDALHDRKHGPVRLPKYERSKKSA
jgi:anthranilate phosphoribosyltransferase